MPIFQENTIKIPKERLFCKDELFLLGFNAFEIYKFFLPVNQNLWKIKKFIMYNNSIIDTFEDLYKTLILSRKQGLS